MMEHRMPDGMDGMAERQLCPTALDAELAPLGGSPQRAQSRSRHGAGTGTGHHAVHRAERWTLKELKEGVDSYLKREGLDREKGFHH